MRQEDSAVVDEIQQNGDAKGTKKGTKKGKGYSADNPVRMYCDGVFDLFHYGHAKALEQAKRLYPHTHLIVGVCTDADTLYHKGQTVMVQRERIESVRQCRWVDEIIEETPWVPTVAFLDQHNIDFVAHDAIPYASEDAEDVYAEVKEAGRFAETQRTEGVSTSELIMRILKDYNSYIARNLGRGYNRKDLGLSLIKEQRIKAEIAVDTMRKNLSASAKNLSASAKNLTKLWKKRDEEVEEKNDDDDDDDEVNPIQWIEDIGTNLDATLTGFITHFERGYRQFERALSGKLKRLSSPDPEHKRVNGGVKKLKHSHKHKKHTKQGLTRKHAL